MAKHKSFSNIGDDLFSAMTAAEQEGKEQETAANQASADHKITPPAAIAPSEQDSNHSADAAEPYIMQQGTIHKMLYFYAKTRAGQLEMKVYEYMNLLLDEARESRYFESINPFSSQQMFVFYGEKTRFSFKLTKTNADWLKQTSIHLGISTAKLLGRIIANEKAREERDGLRQ